MKLTEQVAVREGEMQTITVYRTVAEARNALALDTGFDPFRVGGWGRCTRAKLAAAGYPVDPKEWERRRQGQRDRERQGRCRECGEPARVQTFCDAHGVGNCGRCPTEYTGLCPRHTRYSRECSRGHRWTATDEEDAANDHRCPQCGGYWV